MSGTKHIIITGGVVSGIGKGIVAASVGRLLKNRGYSVSINKLDPYINLDPGTMNPYQHGEVFVTDDGIETDLDIGHYERFIDETLTRGHNTTTGQIYDAVLTKERRGDYRGGTVQVIPGITDEIKSHVLSISDRVNPDILITEIGGTVGDIESLPFLEAVRQIKQQSKPEDCINIHVSLIPCIGKQKEEKTKPTQHSVKELLGIGIQPDILVCRCDRVISNESAKKISMFCNVPLENVISDTDVNCLYEVPLMLERNGLGKAVCRMLNLCEEDPDMSQWNEIVYRSLNPKSSCEIAIVGKYIELHDAYLSVVESLQHGGITNQVRVNINWIKAEDITEETADKLLGHLDGILVPGGFGERGVEGKINAAKYAREHKIPYFGICLGMQVCVIEFARNVLGFKDAHTTEINKDTTHPVICLMEEQKGIENLGGTQRLGAYDCKLRKGTHSYELYGEELVRERHRHRYEFNGKYENDFENAGMIIAGKNPQQNLVEIVEISEHPWFVGAQFHPEFKSRPNRVQPLFGGFVKASSEHALKK